MKSRRVTLQWYCDQRTKLCIKQQRELVVFEEPDLEQARRELFAQKPGSCPCGGKVVRAMTVREEA